MAVGRLLIVVGPEACLYHLSDDQPFVFTYQRTRRRNLGI